MGSAKVKVGESGENVAYFDIEVVNVNEDGSSILVDMAEVRVAQSLNAGVMIGVGAGGAVLLAAAVVIVVCIRRKSVKGRTVSLKQKRCSSVS